MSNNNNCNIEQQSFQSKFSLNNKNNQTFDLTETVQSNSQSMQMH